MKTVQRPLFVLHSVINDRYELVQFLGAGGCGYAVRAHDRALNGCSVVLKFLHHDLVEDVEQFKRFQNEVLLARELTHPNIVRVFDIGKADPEQNFISMEYIPGTSARALLQAHPAGLPAADLSRILQGVAAGMAFAHRRGIIHRDLKPDNILIDQDGSAKIADFGLARMLTVGNSLTATGTTVGTPAYMAPEQFRGEDPDPRSDIYSFGILAYELCFGKKPFESDNYLDLAHKHLSSPLPEPSTPIFLPVGYMRLLESCCHKNPAKRFQTFEEVLKVLERLAPKGSGRKPLSERRPVFSTAVWKLSWRLRGKLVAALVALLLLLGGTIGSILYLRNNHPVILATPVLKLDYYFHADTTPLLHFIDNKFRKFSKIRATPEMLKAAVQANNGDVVRLLLGAGVEPNTKVSEGGEVYPLLLWAIRYGKSADVIEPLLQYGADPAAASEVEQWNALMLALGFLDDSCSPIFNAVISAIDAGPNTVRSRVVNGFDRRGETALIYAIRRKAPDSLEYMKKLLQYPDIFLTDKNKKPALIYAIESGDVRKVETMFAYRVVPENYNEKSPLFYAKDEKMFDLLLARGLPVDAADADGRTTLMYAIEKGQPAIAEKIIYKRGSDRLLRMRSKEGKTALELAKERGMNKIAGLIAAEMGEAAPAPAYAAASNAAPRAEVK